MIGDLVGALAEINLSLRVHVLRAEVVLQEGSVLDDPSLLPFVSKRALALLLNPASCDKGLP